MNISVKKNRVGLFVYHLEGLRLPLLVCVPQFGNHWDRELTREKNHLNNKLKQEITKKNIGKGTCQYGQPG